MNNLTTLTDHTQPTMSSREIAKLCNKRHDNVTRICHELKDKSISPQIEEIKSLDNRGRKYTEFNIHKEGGCSHEQSIYI